MTDQPLANEPLADELLPVNASPAEIALAQACAGFERMPVELGKLWDPDDCPADLLPWLAWALSVDEWDEQWSEPTRRQVIRQSAKTHRQKGTVGAVKRALAALGVSVDFVEWFDPLDELLLAPIHSSRPYTFVFIAWANEQPYTSHEVFLNRQLYAAIQRVVNQTKPARAHFDFLVGAKLQSSLVIGTASPHWSQQRRLTGQTVAVQPAAGSAAMALAIADSRRKVQASRSTGQTVAVQPAAFGASMGVTLLLRRKPYAIARFCLKTEDG